MPAQQIDQAPLCPHCGVPFLPRGTTIEWEDWVVETLDNGEKEILGPARTHYTPQEAALLACLILGHGRTVPRTVLTDAMMGFRVDRMVSPYNHMSVIVHRIRKKWREVEFTAWRIVTVTRGFALLRVTQ